MESTGHEGVILHCVAENYQLCTAKTAGFCSALGGILDNLPHQAHSVHIDARAGGADIDGGTQKFRFAQGFGDGVHQPAVGGGHALLHQGGIAADKVYARCARGAVQRLGQLDRVCDAAGDQRGWGNRNALVDDGHADFALNFLAYAHQVLCGAGDVIVHFLAQAILVVRYAAEEGDAHGDGAHIQLFAVDHVQGG